MLGTRSKIDIHHTEYAEKYIHVRKREAQIRNHGARHDGYMLNMLKIAIFTP